MERNKEKYAKTSECSLKQRKPAKISNLEVLNAVLYRVENRYQWKGLPKEYGDWYVIYVWVNFWAKKDVLQAVFLKLQQMNIIRTKVNVISPDSTCIKVHPNKMGIVKKEGSSLSADPEAGEIPNFIWSP